MPIFRAILVVRNAKCEEKAQSKYEQQCWSDIEKFYAKAEKDFQGKVTSDETDAMTIQLNEDYENLSSEVDTRTRGLIFLKIRLNVSRYIIIICRN